MTKPLVLNLQPTLRADTLFETLIESQIAAKKVWPHRMALDLSDHIVKIQAGGLLELSSHESTYTRSLFPREHGTGSQDRFSNTKIIYQKSPNNPMDFLAANVHKVEIVEENASGICSLIFKVLRDHDYEATHINGMEYFFSETSGFTSSTRFIDDILSDNTAFDSKTAEFDFSVDGGSTTEQFKAYKINYDTIKIVFYGAKVTASLLDLYSINEVYGAHLADINNLPDGEYFLKDEDGEFLMHNDSSTNWDDAPRKFVFDSSSKEFSHESEEGNLTYRYIDDENDANYGKLQETGDLTTIPYEIQNILEDSNGNIILYNPEQGVKKFVYHASTDSTTIEIDNREFSRDDILEITDIFDDSILNIPNSGDLDNKLTGISEALKNDGKFAKIFIEFDNPNIAINNNPAFTNDGSTYYYPNIAETTNIEVKSSSSIIFDTALLNDENTHIRDFVILGKIISYFTSEFTDNVSITYTTRNNAIKFMEEFRTHPRYWAWVRHIWDQNEIATYVQSPSEDFPLYNQLEIDSAATFVKNVMKNSQLISKSLGFDKFANANYYTLLSTDLDKFESVIENNPSDRTKWQKLNNISASLKSFDMTPYSTMDSMYSTSYDNNNAMILETMNNISRNGLDQETINILNKLANLLK